MKRVLEIFSIIGLTVLLSGCGKDKAEELAKDLSYDNAVYYTKYLVSVDGNTDDIDLYYNDEEEGKYLIQVLNDSDYFFKGEIEMYDDSDNKVGTYPVKEFIYPGEYTVDEVILDGTLSTFYVNNPIFYKFTYPNISYKYDLYSDTVEERSIFDVLLEEFCTLDNVKTVAQYEYAVSVVLNYQVQDLYFYDSNIVYYTYTQDEIEHEYPDTGSAIYKATYDYNNKKIAIYELVDNNWSQTDTITMK